MKTLVCLVATAACAAFGLGVAGCGASRTRPSAQQAAASAFLGSYVWPDGRVLRWDQGSDTVSEGQAYGMLLAEVAGDDAAFLRIWEWTRDHMQLRDGLFSFHANAAGKVIGNHPASDADLLIAWALLRYNGPGATALHRAGRRVANAILAREVASGPGRMPVLTAGPWATGSPATLNPSYWSLPALYGLARFTGRAEWQHLAASAVRLVNELSLKGRFLPPDWADLSPPQPVRPEPAPDGTQPLQYGPNAQRTVVWFAVSCDRRARSLAARWWSLLRPGPRSQALALGLNGKVLAAVRTGLSLVASAAAARAAGDRAATSRLLRRASALQRSHPTYYSGAWAALGLALLTGGLGSCHR